LAPKPKTTSPIIRLSQKILLIEGNKKDAATIGGILETAGFDLTITASGRDGLKKAVQTEPDLILIDLEISDISGLELCSLIKKEPRLEIVDTKIVILSNSNDLDVITQVFSAGADDYIIKLPQPTFLLKKIKDHLEMI